jgi:WD40 repeat protein
MVKFTVFAGSYERLLIGIDVTFNEETGKADMVHSIGFSAHTASIRSMAINQKLGLMATGSNDEVIKLYNLNTRKEMGYIHSHQGSIVKLWYDEESGRMVVGADNGSMMFFRCKDYELLKTATVNVKTSRALSAFMADFDVHASGKVALSVGEDGKLRMWDLVKGKCAFSKSLLRPSKVKPEKILFCPATVKNKTDKFGVLFADRIGIYDTETSDEVYSTKNLDQYEKSRGICMCIMDGHILVGHENGSISILEVSDAELKLVKCYKLLDSRIKCLSAVSTENKKLVISACSNGKISVHDYTKGLEVIASKETDTRITCLDIYQPKDKEVAPLKKKQKKSTE